MGASIWNFVRKFSIHILCIKRRENNETETDSLMQRTDLWLPRARGGGEEIDWGFGISRYKLLYIGWISNCIAQGTIFIIL